MYYQNNYFILTATAVGNTQNELWLLSHLFPLTFLVSWPENTFQNVLSYTGNVNKWHSQRTTMYSRILSFYFSYDVSIFLKENYFDVNLYYIPLILMEELIYFLYLPTTGSKITNWTVNAGEQRRVSTSLILLVREILETCIYWVTLIPSKWKAGI